MNSILAFASANPGTAFLAALVLYWLFSAIVSGMPEPMPGGNTGYLWLYRSMHLFAANLDKLAKSKGIGIVLLALLLFPVPVHAQSLPPAIYTASHAALWGGIGLDLGTTLATPGTEADPLLNNGLTRKIDSVTCRNGGLTVITLGLGVLLDRLTHQLVRWDHPKLAAAINFAGAGMHTGAAIWNLRQ